MTEQDPSAPVPFTATGEMTTHPGEPASAPPPGALWSVPSPLAVTFSAVEAHRERRRKAFEMATEHAHARNELRKRHAKDRAAASEEARAALSLKHTDEMAHLKEEQGKERTTADDKAPFLFRGLDATEKVNALAADLEAPAAEHVFTVDEPRNFGLDLDVFDPDTGLVVAAARGAIPTVGQAAHVMTAAEVVETITSARAHQERTR